MNTNPEKQFPGFIRVPSRSFAVQDLDFRVFKLAGSNCAIWWIYVGGVSHIAQMQYARPLRPSAFCLPDALAILHVEPSLPKCVNMNDRPLFDPFFKFIL